MKIKNFLKTNKYLIAGIFSVLILFFVFYPNKTVTIDEHDYLFNSSLLLKGSIKTDCSTQIPGQWNIGEYCISKYNIGTSFFLIPASLFKFNPILITLFIFILCILIFYKLLQEFGLPKFYIIFFALFPPFVYFSRTSLSEIYSMFLISFGFLTLHKVFANKELKKGKYVVAFFAGLSMALSIYVKYTNAFGVVIILLYFLIKQFKNISKQKIYKLIAFLFGFIPLIIFLMLFNLNNYGGIFRSGYYFSSEELIINLTQFPNIFFNYIVILNLIYPLMLILILKSKHLYKNLIITFTFFYLIFYSIVKNETFPGKSTDIILGFRFILFTLPFVLLLYFFNLNNFKLKYLNKFKYKKYLKLATFLILILINIVLSYLHYRFLNQ